MFVDAKQVQGIYCLQVLMNEGIDRRRRFIATVACSLGIGVIINPGWATDNLWVATETMPSGVRAVRYIILSTKKTCSCRVLPVVHSVNHNVAPCIPLLLFLLVGTLLPIVLPANCNTCADFWWLVMQGQCDPGAGDGLCVWLAGGHGAQPDCAPRDW